MNARTWSARRLAGIALDRVYVALRTWLYMTQQHIVNQHVAELCSINNVRRPYEGVAKILDSANRCGRRANAALRVARIARYKATRSYMRALEEIGHE